MSDPSNHQDAEGGDDGAARPQGAPARPGPSLLQTVLVLAILGGAGYMGYRQFNKTTDAAKEVADKALDTGKDIADKIKDTIGSKSGAGGAGGGGAGSGAPNPGKPRDAGDLLGQLVDLAHDGTDAATDVVDGVIGLSLDEEWRYGDLFAQETLPQLKVKNDPALQKRIEALAKPILELNQRTKGRPYTFTIVDEPVVNAFAMIGGHIYIYTGLVDYMKSDRALQFVIGHEIGHVELGHCAKGNLAMIRVRERAGDLAAAVSSMAYGVIQAGFSEKQELASDLHGYQTMRRLKYSKDQCLEGVRALSKYGAENGEPDPKRAPNASTAKTVGELMREHFESHPPSRERVEQLERQN